MNQDPRWGRGPSIDPPPPFGAAKQPPELEMTIDGEFRTSKAAIPLTAKLIGVGILVAIVAGTLAIAAVALWLAMMLVPIALAAALFAYVAFKVRRWRAGSLGGQPLAPRTPFGR